MPGAEKRRYFVRLNSRALSEKDRARFLFAQYIFLGYNILC